jgi:hypothetical protein
MHFTPDARLRDVPLDPMPATTTETTPDTGGERPAGTATSAPAPPIKPRVYWRAVVRSGGQVGATRERDRVEWHLAACASPLQVGSHCTEGRHLIETIGHPDGHCIIDGVCGLCGAAAPED